MVGTSDKTNRSALDKENKGIKGLIRTTCLNQKDQGGGRGLRVKSSILEVHLDAGEPSERRYQ